MSKNIFVCPMKTLNITQGYNGTTSHKVHVTGKNLFDYCLDIAGKDSGRDDFFCPVDKLKLMKKTGANAKGVNVVFCESVTKVQFKNGESDYITMQLTHMNDDDMNKIKEGQVFKRGELMFREGKDGCTANHIHMSIRRGKYIAPGWKQNNLGAWCCISTGKPIKPEDIMYLEESTKVNKLQGLKFPVLLAKEKKFKTTAALNIRQLPSTSAGKLGTYSKDVTIKAIAAYDNWIQTEKGWVCADYCKAVK